MKVRGIFMASLLCGSMLAAVPAASYAQGVQRSLVTPNSTWNVTRIQATKVGGQPYCALARRFSNDVVLTFARNAQDESSLAIDFQRIKFSNQRDYMVTLMPGYGQDRAFEVTPVSGKAIVIRLGQDTAFHDALAKSGRLTVSIGSESYAFSLPDIAEGQHKATQCVAALDNLRYADTGRAAGDTFEMRAARDEYTPARPAYSSGTVEKQTARQAAVPAAVSYDNINEDLAALRTENEQLRVTLERERRDYEDRLMRESRDSNMAAELNERLRTLETENSDLRTKISNAAASQVMAAKTEAPSCKTDATASAETALLKAENDKLRMEIEAQTMRTADLEDQIANQKVDGDVNAGSEIALKKQISDLQAENEGLRESLKVAAVAGQGTVTLAQLRAAEAQLDAVRADRDKLLTEIETARKVKADGLLDVAENDWDLQQATRRYSEAEGEIQRLARKIETEKASCTAEKKQLEYMLFDPEVAEAEQIARLTELENKAAGVDAALSDQKKTFEGKIAALEKDLAVKAELAMAAQTRAAELEAKISENVRLQQTAAASSQELETVKRQRDDLTRQVAELESVRAQNTRLTDELTALRSEVAALRVAAANAPSPEQVRAMNAELASLRQTVAKAPSALEIKTLHDEIATLRAQLRTAQEDLVKAREDAQRAQMLVSSVKQTEGQNQALLQDMESLQQELVNVKELARAQPSVAEVEAIRRDRDRLAQQVIALEDRLVERNEQVVASVEMPAAVVEPARAVSRPVPVAKKIPAAAEVYETEDFAMDRAAEIAAAIAPAAGRASAAIVEAEPIAAPVQKRPMPVETIAAAVSSPLVELDASRSAGFELSEVQNYLAQAGVNLAGTIKSVPGSGGTTAYSWQTGGVFGSAERQPMPSRALFAQLVSGYLQKTRSRCQGDFASMPESESSAGAIQVSTYEIACVGTGGSASASLVFMGRDGAFTVIAHEAGMDNMADAMDIRDRLTAVLKPSQVAMR